MRFHLAVPLTIALLAGVSHTHMVSAGSQPPSERQVRAGYRAHTLALVEKGDFVTLDKELEKLRIQRIRTPSGTWAYPDALNGPRGYVNKLKQSAGSAAPAFALLDKWAKASPRSTVVPVLRAYTYLDIAFDYRGTEYANLVKKEAWAGFNENVAAARKALEQAKSFAAADPEWYGAMEEIAALQSWTPQEFVALLHEAVGKEPTYHFTYFTALRYLSPKWGGSEKSLDEFARWAETAAGAVEGPAMYARIYWYAMENQFVPASPAAFVGASWPKMRAGFEVVLAQYPVDWNLQNYAKFACLARDETKTNQLIQKIVNPIPSAWMGDNGGLYSDCRYYVAKIKDGLP